jgi:GTP-binding protein
VLIDTAGIKRRGTVASGPAAEKYSTMRALKAISRADVAVLVLDAHDGLTAQDAHVAGYVIEEGRGLVIAVNKWDIVEDKTHKSFDELVVELRRELAFIDYAPIVSISAKTGQRVQKVLELAVDVWGERRRRIPTGELNRLIAAAIERTPPAIVHGKRPKIRYATQVAVAPPTFVLFTTDPASVHFSYRRYLENRLRDAYDFTGTPIRLVFREQVREKRPKGRGGRRRG